MKDESTNRFLGSVIAKVVASCLVIVVSALALYLLGPAQEVIRWLHQQVSRTVPLWALLPVAALWPLGHLLWKMLRPRYREYRKDVFYGLVWRWEYRRSRPWGSWCYCPECGCSLHAEEDASDVILTCGDCNMKWRVPNPASSTDTARPGVPLAKKVNGEAWARIQDGSWEEALGRVSDIKERPWFRVLRTSYGTEGQVWDATEEVRRRVTENRRLEILAGNDLVGDPKPRADKRLTIEYAIGTKEYLVEVPELSSARLG